MQKKIELQLIERRWLSAPNAPKEAFYLVFESTSGADFDYQCGDSVGFWPKNSIDEVEKILAHFNIDPTQKIDEVSIRDCLRERYCITHLTEAFEKSAREQLGTKDREIFDQYSRDNAFETASLLDIIDLFPTVKWTAEELLPLLKKMQPRLYSIASAVSFQPRRLDLAIVVVRYKNFRNHDRFGTASHYLCHQLPLYEPITAQIFYSKFKLPSNPLHDVIMIGPGTGIAPFRSFLQERAVLRTSGLPVGQNWLFFGEQHKALNFYFQNELEHWQSTGNLAHLDLAFSRDQEHKIYVQDRMYENGQELWNWLNRGAYIYVCGNAANMAKDVETALLTIIHQYGNIDNLDGGGGNNPNSGGIDNLDSVGIDNPDSGGIDTPEDFLKQLKKEGRYQRDVY